jgi:hypothetical protein
VFGRTPRQSQGQCERENCHSHRFLSVQPRAQAGGGGKGS